MAERGMALPDLEGSEVFPHPDGRAWLKACGVCAHRTHDPQRIGEAYQQRMMRFEGSSVFYCMHREGGGFTRICACYAATHGLPQLARPSPRGGE